MHPWARVAAAMAVPSPPSMASSNLLSADELSPVRRGVIGISCGLANAKLLHTFTFTKHHPIHQLSLVWLSGYLAYGIAEATDISGILTLFVVAVVLAHYSWHSLSVAAQIGNYSTL